MMQTRLSVGILCAEIEKPHGDYIACVETGSSGKVSKVERARNRWRSLARPGFTNDVTVRPTMQSKKGERSSDH
jgi:hypothetical protein